AVVAPDSRRDGARRYLAVLEPDLVDDELALERAEDRLPDLDLLQIGRLEIDLHEVHRAEIAVALGLDAELRQLRQALDIGERHRIEIANLRLAGLEGRRAAAGIGDDLDEDAV